MILQFVLKYSLIFFILHIRYEHVEYNNAAPPPQKPQDNSTILYVNWAVPVASDLTKMFN